MINYSEQITTTVDGDWSVKSISQINIEGIGWTSTVTYVCKSGSEIINTFNLSYSGQDYNNWFQNYSTGTFLIDELIKAKGWNIQTPTNIEQDFLNT